MGYREDRTWADRYLDQVSDILRRNAHQLMDISVAQEDVDRLSATDVVVKLSGGDVAVRLRRPSCDYRDLTLRSRRDSGYRTELAKIKDGYGDWYLYGWIDERDQISEWILVDLEELRAQRLWHGQHEISNYDGTWFIPISTEELRRNNCLVAEQLEGSASF